MTENPQDIVREPKGELAIRTLAMPADANPNGDIFGGWLLSQMDIAGRVVTVAIDAMTFHTPVLVGDVVCCYADVRKVGRTSLTLVIEAWAITRTDGTRRLVTEGTFTYVAIDDAKRPRPVPRD